MNNANNQVAERNDRIARNWTRKYFAAVDAEMLPRDAYAVRQYAVEGIIRGMTPEQAAKMADKKITALQDR